MFLEDTKGCKIKEFPIYKDEEVFPQVYNKGSAFEVVNLGIF